MGLVDNDKIIVSVKDDANEMLYDRTWLLIGRKMANEASSQELKELEEVLKANPELHFTIQALSDLWIASPDKDNTNLEAAYASHLDRIKSLGHAVPGQVITGHVAIGSFQSDTTRLRKRSIIGLSIVAVAVIFFWMITPFLDKKEVFKDVKGTISEISTRNGSKTNILLPDGSRVWLNAGSKLTYGKTFGESTRDVILIGEAYFDVVHNADKPFIIHTRSMDIKVLGTEFNVKSYPNERTTETSLIRGSIEVTLKNRQADKIILKPNEKLVVTDEQAKDSVITVLKKRKPELPIITVSHLNYFSLDSTILETSWVQNRLIFEDESFEEVAVRMSRWYGVTFEFRDPTVQKLRFTGNFQDETINEALNAMQITAEFKYRIADKKVIITNQNQN